MNRTHARPAAAAQRHARPFTTDAIEWEELPSLARTLRRGDLALSVGHVRHSTEPIHGLQVREIEGESVFSHFFGGGRTNH